MCIGELSAVIVIPVNREFVEENLDRKKKKIIKNIKIA